MAQKSGVYYLESSGSNTLTPGDLHASLVQLIEQCALDNEAALVTTEAATAAEHEMPILVSHFAPEDVRYPEHEEVRNTVIKKQTEHYQHAVAALVEQFAQLVAAYRQGERGAIKLVGYGWMSNLLSKDFFQLEYVPTRRGESDLILRLSDQIWPADPARVDQQLQTKWGIYLAGLTPRASALAQSQIQQARDQAVTSRKPYSRW